MTDLEITSEYDCVFFNGIFKKMKKNINIIFLV